MGKKCVFPNCKTGYQKLVKGKNVSIITKSLFKFPAKGTHEYNLWVRFTNRDDIDSLKSPHLCSDHFSENDMVLVNKNRRLKSNACPDANIPFDANQSLTILTPNKGEHLVDYYPKKLNLTSNQL